MSNSVDELYRKLNSVADQLKLQQGREVTVSKALCQLIESMRLQPSDISWSWRINEIRSSTPKQSELKSRERREFGEA